MSDKSFLGCLLSGSQTFEAIASSKAIYSPLIEGKRFPLKYTMSSQSDIC